MLSNAIRLCTHTHTHTHTTVSRQYGEEAKRALFGRVYEYIYLNYLKLFSQTPPYLGDGVPVLAGRFRGLVRESLVTHVSYERYRCGGSWARRGEAEDRPTEGGTAALRPQSTAEPRAALTCGSALRCGFAASFFSTFCVTVAP